jgi:2-phospho-L-lactate guanylyltransferase
VNVGPVAALLPVKAFTQAKVRLAPALAPDARAALARRMAEHVLAVCAPLPTAVVCDDPEVAAWARAHGADVVWEPGRGLNRAVQEGVRQLGAAGARRVIVAHGDLPLAGAVAWVARFSGVTLVPDRFDDGTNVACVPTGAGFRFAYGSGSFRRHALEARRLALGLRVVREPLLGHDVDWPADLPRAEAAAS